MKSFIFLCIILCNTFLITSCNKKVNENQKTREDLIKHVQSVRKILNNATINNNIKTQLEYFADYIVRLDPNKPILRNNNLWIKETEQFILKGGEIKSSTDKILDIWKSENYIYEIGITKVEIILPGEQVIRDLEGKYICIWECYPDEPLKIKYSMWNTSKSVN